MVSVYIGLTVSRINLSLPAIATAALLTAAHRAACILRLPCIALPPVHTQRHLVTVRVLLRTTCSWLISPSQHHLRSQKSCMHHHALTQHVWKSSCDTRSRNCHNRAGQSVVLWPQQLFSDLVYAA